MGNFINTKRTNCANIDIRYFTQLTHNILSSVRKYDQTFDDEFSNAEIELFSQQSTFKAHGTCEWKMRV